MGKVRSVKPRRIKPQPIKLEPIDESQFFNFKCPNCGHEFSSTAFFAYCTDHCQREHLRKQTKS